MRRNIQFTTVATLLFSLAAFSQTLPARRAEVTSVEGITEYSFPNGLRVLLFPDSSKPKVTVNITYLVVRVTKAMARPVWRTFWST